MTSGIDRVDDRRSEIGGERRRQQLVGDHRQRALLARSGDHARHEVAALRCAAVQPVETGGANDERTGRVGERGVLAGELGDRVDAARVRQGVLVVRLGAGAVEDVVGAQVDEPRAGLRRSVARVA